MSEHIRAIQKTRAVAASILADTVRTLDGMSEAAFAEAVHTRLKSTAELFPDGWYDPPAGGIAALWGEAPTLERLKFDTLRNPVFFPKNGFVFGPESVGMIYMSPVDRATGMLGDIGLTLYRGKDEVIREHVQTCYGMIRSLAEYAEVGMTLSDLYNFAIPHFKEEAQKMIGWMITTHDPSNSNLGHTAPGSYGEALPLSSWEETKEAIRSRRVYLKDGEQFVIPDTCAFTVEARLTDLAATLPNAFFHIIVTFDAGTKRVLTDFESIFEAAGMGYML